jgi:hypothetical protein
MQCVDCHNRPTHEFELPERALDEAMGLGRISSTLPYVKKKAMELLKTNYASSDEAARTIPAKLAGFYRDSYPAVSSQRASEIASDGAEIAEIYNRNVFPDLKVTLGHTDFPGCFRCHDGSHSTLERKTTIAQDCNTCHVLFAVDEAHPQVLKTLGLGGPKSPICNNVKAKGPSP